MLQDGVPRSSVRWLDVSLTAVAARRREGVREPKAWELGAGARRDKEGRPVATLAAHLVLRGDDDRDQVHIPNTNTNRRLLFLFFKLFKFAPPGSACGAVGDSTRARGAVGHSGRRATASHG